MYILLCIDVVTVIYEYYYVIFIVSNYNFFLTKIIYFVEHCYSWILVYICGYLKICNRLMDIHVGKERVQIPYFFYGADKNIMLSASIDIHLHPYIYNIDIAFTNTTSHMRPIFTPSEKQNIERGSEM